MLNQYKIYTKLFINDRPALFLHGLATKEQIIQLLKDHPDMKFYWYDTDEPVTFHNVDNLVYLTKVNHDKI